MRLFSLICMVCLFVACKKELQKDMLTSHSFSGQTMGTVYNIKYVGSKTQVSQKAIDSLLVDLNNEVSTYIPESIISILNSSEASRFKVAKSSHFAVNYKIAHDLYSLSNKFYDPSLASLVNFWGFGYTDKDSKNKDKRDVVKLMNDVGFNKWTSEEKNDSLIIEKPTKAKLDFSASAKGYGVDLISEFIEAQSVSSYYVEIGGELRVKGIKPDGRLWTVGVNKPTEESDVNEISKVVQLKNEAMATSGNYRNFYKSDGITYSHIINPFTGFPERSTLLSASILHKECAYADGFATACMVMGKEKCIELLDENSAFEGLLLYVNKDEKIESWQTAGYNNKVLEME